jgi:hypothetical protein
LEKINDRSSSPKSEECSRPEQPLPLKDRINSIDLLGHPIKDFPESNKKKANQRRLNKRKKSNKRQHADREENQTLEDFWSEQHEKDAQKS